MSRTKSQFLGAFGTAFEIWKRIADAVIAAGGNDDDLRRILTDKTLAGKLAALIVTRPTVPQPTIEYITPIADDDVVIMYQPLMLKYRRLATEWGVPATTAVCYRVKAGFTLKAHAPLAGPCHEKFSYLQDWSLRNDESTVDSIVFWIPRLLADSTSKNVVEQETLRTEVWKKYELPEHHLSSFGSAALLVGLILAHFKRTGDRVPLNEFWTRTDTCTADGYSLSVGNFGEDGLFCSYWGDGERNHGLGVFPLGVEILGH